ncbi:MAG TPA: spermidine/putrescine ABC transporter substrate-binding protein, partial [Pseudomonas sp.]|nr:spermidine/putrescine ABC transporter substrate-binding protein [Pseudomonas sp.]
MSAAKTLLLTLFLLTTVGSVQAKELVFLNWADYMDPEIILEFKQRT